MRAPTVEGVVFGAGWKEREGVFSAAVAQDTAFRRRGIDVSVVRITFGRCWRVIPRVLEAAVDMVCSGPGVLAC